MSSIGDGIENAESCYGVPFLVSRPGLAVNYASVFTNVGCAFLVALLAWLMILGFFRYAWYQYHFETFIDDDEEEESYRKLKPRSEAAQKANEGDVVMAQLVHELPEVESDVVMPEINQLKMMAIGTKLVFWAGCLSTIYIVVSFIFSTLSMIFNIELATSIGMLILIGVILDLVGRIYCLNSANTNEQATNQIVLACSVIAIGIVVCWVLSLALMDSPPQIAISFGSVCVGLLLLIVCLIGTAASIGYCGAISNNTGNMELGERAIATGNAYIFLVIFGVILIPLGYAIIVAIDKRKMSPDDLRTTVAGVIMAFQFVVGSIAIFATVQHLLMYRCAEKFLFGLAKHREKSEGPKDPIFD